MFIQNKIKVFLSFSSICSLYKQIRTPLRFCSLHPVSILSVYTTFRLASVWLESAWFSAIRTTCARIKNTGAQSVSRAFKRDWTPWARFAWSCPWRRRTRAWCSPCLVVSSVSAACKNRTSLRLVNVAFCAFGRSTPTAFAVCATIKSCARHPIVDDKEARGSHSVFTAGETHLSRQPQVDLSTVKRLTFDYTPGSYGERRRRQHTSSVTRRATQHEEEPLWKKRETKRRHLCTWRRRYRAGYY